MALSSRSPAAIAVGRSVSSLGVRATGATAATGGTGAPLTAASRGSARSPVRSIGRSFGRRDDAATSASRASSGLPIGDSSLCGTHTRLLWNTDCYVRGLAAAPGKASKQRAWKIGVCGASDFRRDRVSESGCVPRARTACSKSECPTFPKGYASPLIPLPVPGKFRLSSRKKRDGSPVSLEIDATRARPY